MKADPTIEVVQVTHEHLPRLRELWRADWLEEHPGDEAGAAGAAAGLDRALAHHDFLRSDSFWLFAAQAGGRFVGYMTVARIPKADGRLLFLFIDELFVLQGFRRRGAARALLRASDDLAAHLSAQGVRLIVDAGNGAARRLYAACGFTQRPQLFCERRLR